MQGAAHLARARRALLVLGVCRAEQAERAGVREDCILLILAKVVEVCPEQLRRPAPRARLHLDRRPAAVSRDRLGLHLAGGTLLEAHLEVAHERVAGIAIDLTASVGQPAAGWRGQRVHDVATEHVHGASKCVRAVERAGLE
eukprot:7381627-Prymnesium_polylepis.3